MKGIFIEEIKTKTLDVPDRMPFYKRMKYKSFARSVLKEGEIPSKMIDIEEEIFYLHRVSDGFSNIKNYFVRHDEEKTFKELVAVGEETINARIRKALETQRDEYIIEIYNAEARQRNKIRKLPWYKRLFNKF